MAPPSSNSSLKMSKTHKPHAQIDNTDTLNEIRSLAQSSKGANATIYQTLLVSLDPTPNNVYDLAKLYVQNKETNRGKIQG